MLSTLFTSLKLKNTYWVNSRLYTLKRIPGIKNLLSDSIYSWGWVKALFTVFGIIREILTTFIYKFLYIFIFVIIPLVAMGHIGGNSFLVEVFNEAAAETAAETNPFTIGEMAWPCALNILFFLTLIGTIFNNDFFDGSMDKYYATELLKLDYRKYTLSNYAYFLFRAFIGFVPTAWLLCVIFDLPSWWVAVIPAFVVTAKISFSALDVALFSVKLRKGKLYDEPMEKATPFEVFKLALVGMCFAAAYLPAAVKLPLPAFVTLTLMILVIAIGIIGLVKLIKFKGYREFCRQRLADFFSAQGMAKSAASLSAKKSIDDMPTATSDKKGFEFLNDIFIKRHKKLLWKSVKRITLILIAIIALLVLALIFPVTRDYVKDIVNDRIINGLTLFPLILYFINKGRGFTQALFMNCDHSLLTYPFYKEPKHILHLFRLRLVEISKLNLLPASVLGVGLVVLLYLSGGAEKPIYYPIVFLTVTGTSIFFSIHYLVMYYLLQPYNSETEAISGLYNLIMGATYFVCYFITQQEIPIMIFGLSVIGFCVLYSIIALILAYRLAPKTFRIKI